MSPEVLLPLLYVTSGGDLGFVTPMERRKS
jgi:hypothetical protein